MPRPRKCRKVCCLPDNDGFVPVRGGEELTPIVLNVDEYESIRLIDREGFSQEQCGKYMLISRTTVQQIYAAARKKLADALVEGLPLRIEGGDFTLCSGNSAAYGCTEGGCPDLRRYWRRCPDGTERCGYPALWWCFRQR